MIDRDRKQFFTLIADVSAFYKQDFSDFSGGVWWEALKPYDFEAVADALNRHAVNPDVGQFMPKPADVVRMLQGSTMDSALVAWSKVDRGIRVVGTHRSVVFDDPLIHRIVTEMGGWVMLGTKTDKDWPYTQNEFVNRYRGYRAQSRVPEFPPVLVGIAEASNSQKNKPHREPPTLIGDTMAAQKVLAAGTGRQLIDIKPMAIEGSAEPQRIAAA